VWESVHPDAGDGRGGRRGKCKLLVSSRNSVISSSLVIRFNYDVVIPRNRPLTPPCIPTSYRLARLGMTPIYFFPYPMSNFMSLFISLCTNVPSYPKEETQPN